MENSAPGIAPLMDAKHVATVLNMPITTLSDWRTRHPDRLPFVKVGRHVRYRQSDIEAFINKNVRGVTDAVVKQ